MATFNLIINLKSRKRVYIVLGVILIVVNLYLEITEYLSNPEYFSLSVGSILGWNVLLLLGILLLRSASKLNGKIKKIEQSI